jgi:hypothetical protein
MWLKQLPFVTKQLAPDRRSKTTRMPGEEKVRLGGWRAESPDSANSQRNTSRGRNCKLVSVETRTRYQSKGVFDVTTIRS